MKEKKEVDIVLFGVEGDKNIKKQYPELSSIEEFKDLDPSKVKFAWLMGNPTSPIISMERNTRMKKATTIVWGSRAGSILSAKEIFESKTIDDLPDEIFNAINKMANFDVSYRLKAKLMAEYMFARLTELIVVDDVTFKAYDIDDKKKYAELMIKVNSELASMVSDIENSFGVKAYERGSKKEIKVTLEDIS